MHGGIRAASPPAIRTAANLPVPAGVDLLSGREQANALRPVLDRLGVHGEVGFIRPIPKDHRLVLSVIVPGREVSVDLNLATRSATVTEPRGSTAAALVYLHKMPGQHLANLRGNSLFMHVWRWLADATVWLVLFLSISGIYLWVVLRAERRIGLALIAAGAVTFYRILLCPHSLNAGTASCITTRGSTSSSSCGCSPSQGCC